MTRCRTTGCAAAKVSYWIEVFGKGRPNALIVLR
jgi:hypothetical protein